MSTRLCWAGHVIVSDEAPNAKLINRCLHVPKLFYSSNLVVADF